MASKSSEVVILENEELEDGEIEDDIEEFNEYESLFQSSDTSTESRLSKVANKHNIRREKERTSVRNKSHSARIGHRREKSKSPSGPKSHGGLPGRRRTSPVPSKRSHRRRTSSADIAKGLRQKAETRLRRRRRGESPPKPTMRYLLHQRHPTITSSHPKKKRRESDMEQYEHLLLKHRELQEAIEMEKSILIRSSGPDVIEIETRSNRKKTSRSRSRSGSQKDALEKVERKQLHVDQAALAIQEDADDSDDEMDELQLRMIALQSATRAVAAREEKENKEELLLEMEKENGIDFEDMNCKKDYGPIVAYGKSKLANVLFTRELARRLQGSGVTTYTLHPGGVKTDLQRTAADQKFWTPLIFNPVVYWLFFKTPLEGSQTTIFCAVDESVATKSGKYYANCAEKEPSKQAQDDEVARRLWEVSAKMVNLEQTL